MEDLNKEEQLLYLKIKSELQDSVDERVSNHLDRDRNLIKNTLSSVSRVIIWIVGLFSILLTLLGIKTYRDIKSAIEDTAKSSIETELSKTDILKQYDKKAKILYLNALVESLLIKIEKSRYERFTRLELSDENAIFLIYSLKDKSIDKEIFEGILEILGKMRFKPEIREDLEKVLKKLLSPDFYYDSYRTEKLVVLFKKLDKFDKEEFKKLARSYLKNTDESQAVRIESMKYLKNVWDYDIIEYLEELAVSQDEDLKNASIISLSYLDFSNDQINNFNEENKMGEMNLTKARKIIDVLCESLDGIYNNYRRSFFDEPNEVIEQKCRDLAANNIKYLIDNGVRFTFSKFSSRDEKPGLRIYMSTRTSTFSGISEDIFFKHHIETKILNDTKNSLIEFTRYLKAINNINIPRREEQARIAVAIKDTVSLNLIDSKILGSEINGNLILVLDDSDKLIAKWWDFSGILINKEVADLNSLEQFKFVSKEEFIDDNIRWK